MRSRSWQGTSGTAVIGESSCSRGPRVFWTATLFLAVTSPLLAQVPTGFQEYFILGRTQHVWDMMDKVEMGEGGGPFAAAMNEVITATASADNQVIFYDHWEDGFEADIFNPVQLSTLIIGDGDPSNGDACDFNNDPCGVDVMLRSDFVNFASNQGIAAGCTVPSASPLVFTELCSSVPVNERCLVLGACANSEVHFDGGDLLVTTGGPLSLVHSQDPLTQFIGGSTEVISRQAVEAARSYSVPIGEDLYVAFGCPPDCVMEPFHYVDLNLVAFEDGTQVFVDSPGAGTVSFILDRGEHWSSLGYIDDLPQDLTKMLIINSGTKVSTSAPVAGMMFAGGDGQWATRHYTLLPDILHSTDYLLTAPGDDPAVGPSVPDRPLNVYIFNPDPLNALTVTVTDSIGSTVVPVPTNSVVDYFTATGRFVPVDSTVRMISNRNFWGVSAYDHITNISDWGHSWLAKKFLTSNYTVSFAPGTLNPPVDMINLNGVYVSATENNTHVQIDLDADGLFDLVDLDGDGIADPAPLPNNTYVVNALGALSIFDPNDFDNTGTRLETNKPVAVAYGQETDLTGFGDTALDTGFTVYPVNQLFLDAVLIITKTTDTSVVPTAGGVVTYTLTINSFEFGPITNLQVFDLLPPGVTGADYVIGSTLITYPNLLQDTTDPTASIDPGTGRDRLDWTLSPDTMGTNQTLTVTYSINIPPAPGGTPRQLTNEGHAEGTLGGSTFSPLDTADVVQTDISLVKSVDMSSPAAGDVLTFTLMVSNLGVSTETNPIITDAIPSDTTFVGGSITDSGPFAGSGTFDPAQNAVVWTAASFPPGGPHALSFQVQVNPGVPRGTEIPNRGSYESVETPFFLSNEVAPVVVGPELVLTKTGPAVLHPGEIATFEITVENVGTGAANNLIIVDPFPANATYVSESMEFRFNIDPFTSVTDAIDADEGTEFADRLELAVASLGATQDLTFRFQVQVNPGTDGMFVNNQATVASDEVIPKDTNLVQVPIIGSSQVTGHVFLDSDGNGVQDPGEPDLANVDVEVTSTPTRYTCTPGAAIPDDGYDGTLASMVCCSIHVPAVNYGAAPAITDIDVDVAITHTFVGDLTLKLVSPTNQVLALLNRPGSGAPDDGTDTPFGDSSNWASAPITFDDDGGGPSAETLGAALGGGGNVCTDDGICNYTPAPDTAGGLANLAGFDGGDPRGNWLLCAGDSAGGAAGTLDSVALTVISTDTNTVTQTVTTDANGDYTATVAGSQATLDVDENDPDMPHGAILTTANDPQTVPLVLGGTTASPPVGYTLPALTFTKTSDALMNEVFPGQTVTYTITMTNNTAVTQTGIDINDPLPAGTTFVPGSTQVTVPAFRVTEYLIGPGDYPGTTLNLTLNQDLLADYFVLVQGSDGDGTGGGGRGPDENYAALTADPFATGDLAASGASDVITLTRGNSVGATDWQGVVTVVESIGDPTGNGFDLRSVEIVDHLGAGLAGADVSAVAWTDINQVLLMGGSNGAGCETADPDTSDHKVCHVRLFPSGVNTINWTRDDVDTTSMSTASSTVMVVEWGAAWNVQRVNVTGNNGGDGADMAAEYNTAGIGLVARDNTWVWGTGHTNDQGIGDAAEGVLVTLGDGAVQNANEVLVAAGLEFAGNDVDFEVWALTYANLAVDYRFLNDGVVGGGPMPGNGAGDSDDLVETVTVDPNTGQRMALVTNGQNGNGNAYPRPIFSARYTAPTTVTLQRRRSGQQFPAWVQGIEFPATAVEAGGAPANLVVPADAYILPPGQTMTVTFQVVVDDPLAPAITEIENTATVNTDQEGPFNDTVTDTVIRLGVTVEPNSGSFTTPGSTVTYNHEVVNTGEVDDAYEITVNSELGFMVELLDPDTGAVIATDSNGDGVWDGGITVNTGILMPGESVPYQVRVTVPGGTPVGTKETTRLFATSDRNASLQAFATDETIVVDPSDIGPVILISDQSGVITAGGTIAYTHTLINNTGATDTFDLFSTSPTPGWTSTIYADTNGDGVYTPGTDLAISNSLQLDDGESQRLFLVIDAPAGAMPGDTDVTPLSAFSRNDPGLGDSVSDTTTVLPASSHDISGGDTLLIDQGETAVFPGTIDNLSDTDDRFNLTITASPFAPGEPFADGLNHPTQLFVDTDADGIPDLQIAEDADGDGTWDTVDPAFDLGPPDGNPDVFVPAGQQLAYELRRPVDPAQTPLRDPVTLSATSQNTGEVDSVTAVNLLAAATHAVVSSFDAYSMPGSHGEVVVEWRTSYEQNTLGFYLLRRKADGSYRKVSPQLLPGLLHSPLGGTYRYVDSTASSDATHEYQLVEVDVRGRHRRFGPFRVAVGEREAPDSSFARVSGRYSRETHGVPFSRTPVVPAAQAAQTPSKARQADDETAFVKLIFEDAGLYFVAAAQLATAFGVSANEIADDISDGELALTRRLSGGPSGDLKEQPLKLSRSLAASASGSDIFDDGFETGSTSRWSFPGSSDDDDELAVVELAWFAAPDDSGIYFYGQEIDSIYTDNNVYWLERDDGRTMGELDGGSPTASPGSQFQADFHLEETADESFPLTSVFEDPDGDFWFWDGFVPSLSFNYTVSTPGLAGAPDVLLTVHFQGETDTDHLAEIRLNGNLIGTAAWSGPQAHSVALSVSPSLFNDGDNTVNLTSASPSFGIFYLDSYDVVYPRFYRAVGDELEAKTDANPVITVESLTRPDVTVFDISDPDAPQVVTGTSIDDLGAEFRVSFVPAAPNARYLVSPLDQAMVPLILIDEPSHLTQTSNRADYVVIAAQGLESAAQELADLRDDDGFNAEVVELEDVYDEFSGGVVSPWAIRDFLAYARENWSLVPRYVVLAGDSSFDFKNRLGQGGNLLPSPMVRTADGLFPSDHRLADLVGGDGIPEVAIGRLPVRTNGELAAYVAKLIARASASGAWTSETVWVADATNEGGEFSRDSDGLIPLIPPSLSSQRIYVDELGFDSARQQMLDSLAAGSQLLNFLGHGGLDRMGDKGLLLQSDVASLNNGERLPIVVAVTCAVGRFDRIFVPTLGDQLVLHDQGGAIALWAPSGLSFNVDGTLLLEGLLSSAFGAGSGVLGDAIKSALSNYLLASEEPDLTIPFVYNLLGDPALELVP